MPISVDLQKALEAPLPKDAVKTRAQSGQSLSYVEGWYAIDQANRVFGFDGWHAELLDQRVVHQYERTTARGKNLVMIMHATVRVRALGVVRDDTGVGLCDAPADNPASGIEKALKEAATDGLKRCLRTFGYRFGLALYDKSQEHVGGSAEAIRLLSELEQLAWRELDAWAKRNAEALKSLDDTDKAAVRAVFKARKEHPPTALEQLRDDLASVDTRDGLRAVWQEHARAIQGMCEPPNDGPLRDARAACWQRAQVAGLARTKAELDAILRGTDGPNDGGTRAPAPANDPPADDPERAAIQAESPGARTEAALRAYLAGKYNFTTVRNAAGAHAADYDVDRARYVAVCAARLQAVTPGGLDDDQAAAIVAQAIADHVARAAARTARVRRTAAALAIVTNARKVA